jgi:hypothetical protein
VYGKKNKAQAFDALEGQQKATSEQTGCLVTECMEGCTMLTRETCSGQDGCSLLSIRVRRAHRTGVRASIIVKKRRNGCGAKGRREVDV